MKTKYKDKESLAGMSALELVKYKKYMLARSKDLLQAASDWKYTYNLLMQELDEKFNELEYMLLEAELDRQEAEGWEFEWVTGVH